MASGIRFFSNRNNWPRAMHDSGVKPKTLHFYFLAVTAEEKKACAASAYFAFGTPHSKGKKSSPDPLNMDSYLPLFPLKYLEVQGLGESSWAGIVTAVAKRGRGVTVSGRQNNPITCAFIRSDSIQFIQTRRRAVRWLSNSAGCPGTPQEKLFNDWYKERYHGG